MCVCVREREKEKCMPWALRTVASFVYMDIIHIASVYGYGARSQCAHTFSQFSTTKFAPMDGIYSKIEKEKMFVCACGCINTEARWKLFRMYNIYRVIYDLCTLRSYPKCDFWRWSQIRMSFEKIKFYPRSHKNIVSVCWRWPQRVIASSEMDRDLAVSLEEPKPISPSVWPKMREERFWFVEIFYENRG